MEKSIEGIWKNQLGSEFKIKDVKNGMFIGHYGTAVGNVKKEDEHNARGTYQVNEWTEEKTGKTHKVFLLSWSVQWKKMKKKDAKPSCTTWNAQAILEGEKVVAIDSTWLLRRFSTSKNLWDAVLTSKDYFVKN